MFLNDKMQKIKQNIALQIKRERRKKGLTQEDLAKKMKATQSFVSKIESGRVMPEKKTLARIVEALGLKEDHFNSCYGIEYDSLNSISSQKSTPNTILEKLKEIQNLLRIPRTHTRQDYIDNIIRNIII